MISKQDSSLHTILQQSALLALLSLPLHCLLNGQECSAAEQRRTEASDQEICQRKFNLAVSRSLNQEEIGNVMVEIGSSFIGTPYAAKTLEVPGKEHLVINLQGLDCVTFVENTLALSRCVKMEQPSFEEYKHQLQLIRYRAGIVDKYPSRLHYFSDWIHDNANKNIIRDVTKELGGVPYEKTINFMSAHQSSYHRLSESAYVEMIKEVEAALTSQKQYYIPKERLTYLQDGIHNGDVIAITTSIDGLDISHAGLAIRIDGMLRYLHAPLSTGSVRISDGSLVEYLMSHKNQTGIMVARPLEP
jgi:hypothetical protein